MSNDDPFEGLDVPDDPTADLDRATQSLTVRTEERRYGKKMVVVEGFETGSDLEDHVERRHPKEDVRWWMVAERPNEELQFSGR
mgnify:CR=1 FL=1